MLCKTVAVVTFVQIFMRIVHFLVELFVVLFCLFSALPIMAKQSLSILGRSLHARLFTGVQELRRGVEQSRHSAHQHVSFLCCMFLNRYYYTCADSKLLTRLVSYMCGL